MKKRKNGKRTKNAKRDMLVNVAVPVAAAAFLAVYFTAKSMWGVPQAAILLLLLAVAGFYFWLWRYYHD
ncbi:MAG: hypothetical protein LBI38_03860 [Oscillospiraceae bacterium]|jgi:hypothetical protein|nr:hypothetical protein [Oscillospiraceae bacterium]